MRVTLYSVSTPPVNESAVQLYTVEHAVTLQFYMLQYSLIRPFFQLPKCRESKQMGGWDGQHGGDTVPYASHMNDCPMHVGCMTCRTLLLSYSRVLYTAQQLILQYIELFRQLLGCRQYDGDYCTL